MPFVFRTCAETIREISHHLCALLWEKEYGALPTRPIWRTGPRNVLWEGRTHRSSRFSLSRHTAIVFVVVTSSTVGCLEGIVAARTVLLPPNGHRAKAVCTMRCGVVATMKTQQKVDAHKQTKV